MKLTELRSQAEVRYLMDQTRHLEFFKTMHDNGSKDKHFSCCRVMKYEYFDKYTNIIE